MCGRRGTERDLFLSRRLGRGRSWQHQQRGGLSRADWEHGIRQYFASHHLVGCDGSSARMAYLHQRGKVVLEATVKTQIHNGFQPRRKKAHQGFSLVEVMISIALLTIGLLSLLGIFGYAMAATQGSQENATAKLLAAQARGGYFTAARTRTIRRGQ